LVDNRITQGVKSVATTAVTTVKDTTAVVVGADIGIYGVEQEEASMKAAIRLDKIMRAKDEKRKRI